MITRTSPLPGGEVKNLHQSARTRVPTAGHPPAIEEGATISTLVITVPRDPGEYLCLLEPGVLHFSPNRKMQHICVSCKKAEYRAKDCPAPQLTMLPTNNHTR